MDAFFVRNRLSAYLDGELPSGEARDVESALAQDPGLRQEFEALRDAVELLRAEGIVEPPAGFTERVLRAVEAEPMPSGWRRITRHVRMEAVLLAAAALFVVTWVSQKPDLTPETAADVTRTTAPPATMVPAAAPEPSPLEVTGRNEAMAKSAPRADGMLGNEATEKLAAAPLQKQAMAQRGSNLPGSATTTGGGNSKGLGSYGSGGANRSDVEKEAFQPEWEKKAELATPSAEAPVLYSPAPIRYQLSAKDESVLKQLAAIATSLGGELQDKNGRKIAPYLMNQGDLRTIRIVVPTYNEDALAKKLRELGEVHTITTKDTTLLTPGEGVPVQVDISY